jgi:hypothetical protein
LLRITAYAGQTPERIDLASRSRGDNISFVLD